MEHYIKEAELRAAGNPQTIQQLQALCDWIKQRVSGNDKCMGLSNQAAEWLQELAEDLGAEAIAETVLSI